MTRQRERPLGLDMAFGEALERLIGVEPAEIPDEAKLLRKKPPPKRGPDVTEKREAG